MNGNTVRAPGAPIARRRTASSRKGFNRDSGALRASVLDVAMQIGLGIDGAVTDWVYNNSVNEEEEPTPSPGSTFCSSAASEDWSSTSSARFPYSPPSSSRSIVSSTRSVFSPRKLFAPGALAIPEEPTVPDTNSEEGARSDYAANVPTPTSVTSPDAFAMPLPSIRIPTKLRKRRGDGYESDAGYVSDAKGKKKDKKKNSGRKVGENDEAEVMDEEAQREPTKNKEPERQRARSFTSQGTGVDGKTSDSLTFKGYETDAPIRKSRFGRKKRLNAGYETDASNTSSPSLGLKKSRAKFFRLGGKSSKSELVATASKNWPPFAIGQKSEKGLHPNAATQLPALPPLPSMGASFADSISIQDYIPPTSPASSPVSTPPVSAPPAISTTSIPLAKSGDLMKGPSSEKQVRDSHLSSESSRSSASNASSIAGREARSPKHKSLRFFSSSKSSSSGKFPVISLPLGRPISPYSEVNMDSNQQDQNRSESLLPDSLRSPQESRGQYTSPALLSAVPSSTPPQCPVLPTLLPSGSPSFVISASEPSSNPVSRNRHRGSQLTVATNLGIMPSLTRLPSKRSKRISQSPAPPPEWLVHPPATNGVTPSPASNGTLVLPNSNTLSYYDIPPPSPPPNAPLPKVPAVVQSAAEDDPFGINATSVIPSLSLSNRCSKDIPFLARLRARAGSHNSAKNHDTTKGGIRAIKHQISEPLSIAIEADHQRQSYSSKGQETDGDDIDRQIQDVLDRFADTTNNRDGHEVDGRALGRSRSFEALKNEFLSVPVASSEGGEGDIDEDESFYSREFSRKGLYYSDQEEDGVDPRLSRWSGSVYSRASMMDSQKSEETRARFVKRVEAMLDEAGIERGNKRDWDAVPPVPKLPECLARSNILTRQNQLKAGDSSWIQF
ncbi:hypothetical protein APHAL10511_003089 [Amanita phalloides]|nr:hypothetical protein APHAL10511_003089 [Amanita phalloides]